MSNRRKPTRRSDEVTSLADQRAWPDPPKVAQWREQLRNERRGHHGINAWKCQECGMVTVSIDVDPGVTPMMLGCRRTPGCNGMAVSGNYPASDPPEHILALLEWEWRRATKREHRNATPGLTQHIEGGGLVLAPRTDRPSAYL